MAYSLLAKSGGEIDWEFIHKGLKINLLNNIEIFPIPGSIGFENDALGITVPSKNINKEAEDELFSTLSFLIEINFEIIELYDGVKVTPFNIRKITRLTGA
jgi:hypothetical protein